MEKKERLASSHAATKIEKVAQEMDRALRSPGNEFVPANIKQEYQSMADVLWKLKMICGKHAEQIIPFDSFVVPPDLAKTLDSAKKSAAIFAMHTKSFLQQNSVCRQV